MKRLFLIFLITIKLISRSSNSYNYKILEKTSGHEYTFLNFKPRRNNINLTAKHRSRLSFVPYCGIFRGSTYQGSCLKNHLTALTAIDEFAEIKDDDECLNENFDIFPKQTNEIKPVDTLEFSDFTDLYKDFLASPMVYSLNSEKESEYEPLSNNVSEDSKFLFDESSYSLSKRLFVKKLFKKIPQFIETESFLVRSKAYVKGVVGSRCDLSVFDTNKVSTGNISEKPFESVKTILPGVFTGLHTVKHTKKRIIRELRVKVDLYVKALGSQIKNMTNFFGELLRHIHPFQYNLLKTSLHDIYFSGKSKISFENLLSELSKAKKQLVLKGNEINKEIPKIKKCREAFKFVKSGILELDSIYSSFQNLYDYYNHYCSQITSLPVVDIEKPIIALIGHVNVGKTTFFNKISQGLLKHHDFKNVSHIEIISDSLGLKWSNMKNNFKRQNKQAKEGIYKFTTRGINLSTLNYKVNNFIFESQLIDTPGLLWRGGHTNFNPYEKLTYSVLKDLPCGVLFCFDLSGNNSINDQVDLYLSLKSRFPQRPWINVIVQGNEFRDKLRTLNDLEIETIENFDVYPKIQSMFKSIHNILNL